MRCLGSTVLPGTFMRRWGQKLPKEKDTAKETLTCFCGDCRYVCSKFLPLFFVALSSLVMRWTFFDDSAEQPGILNFISECSMNDNNDKVAKDGGKDIRKS